MFLFFNITCFFKEDITKALTQYEILKAKNGNNLQ